LGQVNDKAEQVAGAALERVRLPAFFVSPQKGKDNYKGHYTMGPRYSEDKEKKLWSPVAGSSALRFVWKGQKGHSFYEDRIVDFVLFVVENLPAEMRGKVLQGVQALISGGG
jgi:hypothetical protein